MRALTPLLALPALVLSASPQVTAQTFPTDDPVIEGIWR